MGHQPRFTVCPVVGPDAHIHVYCRVPSNSTPRTNCQIDRSVDRLPLQTQMCMHVNMCGARSSKPWLPRGEANECQ